MKAAAETHKILHEAYGSDAVSQMTTYKWFKRFKTGRTSMDDDEHLDQTLRSEPLTVQMKTIICGNRRLRSCRRV
jgi:hypothetical protein